MNKTAKPEGGKVAGNDRDVRLKQALRANLRRRKDQARARKTADNGAKAGEGQD